MVYDVEETALCDGCMYTCAVIKYMKKSFSIAPRWCGIPSIGNQEVNLLVDVRTNYPISCLDIYVCKEH